jgi:NUMOD3 motif
MAAEFLIYGLADPRTGFVHYIGKSKTALRRPRRHGAELLHTDPTPKGDWVRGLVADGYRYEIRVLEELPGPEDLDDAECFWIAQGRALRWPLVNVTRGGKGTVGMRHSEAARSRISTANRGREQTEAHREANSAGVKAHWASGVRGEEYRAKLSAALRGRAPAAARMKRTPEWKANMARAQRERRERERLAREGASCR